MSSSAELSSAARDGGSYNIFVIRHSDFVIFPLVIRTKTALVSASRFAARLRSARDHGRDVRVTWLTIDAQPLFTHVDPGADVRRGAGKFCTCGGNSSAGAG